MACCIQNQISEGAHENLYRQNAVHPEKIYSQIQLRVLVLQSRKQRNSYDQVYSSAFAISNVFTPTACDNVSLPKKNFKDKLCIQRVNFYFQKIFDIAKALE